MNRLFRDFVVARIASAVREARAAAAVPHPGVRGQIREILIRDLFRPLLPTDMGVGHGQIVSAVDERVSTEQDIVIYDRRLLPPLLYEGSLGLFPLECSLAAVEVKSRLTREELRGADEKAGTLFDFQYQSGLTASVLGSGSVPVERVMATVFALDTDLSQDGTTEIERYDSLPGRHPEALRALCVVGRGYWFRWHDRWETTARSFEFAEVAAFIAGTLGALSRVAVSRRAPSLVNYLFQQDEIPALDPQAV
jgi:Domain of unknown function (DUF6602)